MDFLRRLAASATRAPLPGAARAALPTRFRPTAAADNAGDETLRDHEMAGGTLSGSRADVLTGAAPTPNPQSQAPRISVQRTATAPSPAFTPMPHPPAERIFPREARSESKFPDGRTPHILERLARVEQKLDTRPDSLGPADTGLRSPLVESDAFATPAAPVPGAHPRQGPLSDAALAARLVPQDERTVVHVTIDRIDVRAPAAQPAAQVERPPRRTSPSVSLANYLRGARSSGETP